MTVVFPYRHLLGGPVSKLNQGLFFMEVTVVTVFSPYSFLQSFCETQLQVVFDSMTPGPGVGPRSNLTLEIRT